MVREFLDIIHSDSSAVARLKACSRAFGPESQESSAVGVS